MGVTEIHLVMMLANFLSYWFGDEFYQKSPMGLSLPYWILGGLVIMMFINLPMLATEAWEKAKDKSKFYLMLVPISLYISAILLSYVFLPSLYVAPGLGISLVFNVTFNILAIKIITASLTRMDYGVVHVEIVALYVFLILMAFREGGDSEKKGCGLICWYSVGIIARLLHLATSIILDISGYLKINVFVVP